MSMADHLAVVVANYTSTELSVTPHTILTETSDKSQIVYEADDGNITVVSKSDSTIFTVTLQWDAITASEKETIEEFYNSATKANGREYTFYWHHPTDGEIYTVRFMTPLEVVYKAGYPTNNWINQVVLRVHGTKS